MSELTKQELDAMLEEVSVFEITLAEDPTLPTLGIKYLQAAVAKCRNYSNRVTYYISKVSLAEKSLKREIKQLELDLEFKMAEKLADDEVVRKQPSIEDRKSTATAMLKQEFENLAEMRVRILDLEQTKSMLKMKYSDLQRTAADIKLQRQMVKDDMVDQLGGGEGYVRPQVNPDRSVPHGMRPPVAPPPDPKDLLDPAKRPLDIPEPKDEAHAALIADFLARNPENTPRQNEPEPPEAESPGENPPLDYFPQIGFCSVCNEPQYDAPPGSLCKNGHGGAPTISEPKPKAPPAESSKVGGIIDYDSLLD